MWARGGCVSVGEGRVFECGRGCVWARVCECGRGCVSVGEGV